MEKITKRKFIAIMNEKLNARENKDPISATEMYELFMSILTEELLKGNPVILTSFGAFDLKPHRGHHIHFSDNSAIDDYLLVKFDASNVFNRRLRHSDPELFNKIVSREKTDGTDDDDKT